MGRGVPLLRMARSSERDLSGERRRALPGVTEYKEDRRRLCSLIRLQQQQQQRRMQIAHAGEDAQLSAKGARVMHTDGD